MQLDFSTVRATLLIGFAVYLVVALIRAFLKWFKMFSYFQAIPGDPDFSIIWGNLHNVFGLTSEGRLARNHERIKWFPRFSRFWSGPFTPRISFHHPETLKLLYQSSAPKAKGFGDIYNFLDSWIGNGLISSNHGIWARNRRLLTPGFHFDILKNYMQVYHESADILINKLDKFAETGESFDMCPLIKLCTLDVIMKCAMGYDANVQEDPKHPYVVATSELNDLAIKRAMNPLHYFDLIYNLSSRGKRWYKHCNLVHKVTEDIITQRREALAKDGPPKQKRLDFLDILLTAVDTDGKSLTPLEIRHEVDTFMFAGHDTTAAAFGWILYALADCQEHLKKVQEELDGVVGEDRDSSNIEWQDLSKLKHMAVCIKESMRLYPPVPFTGRILDEDLEIDGYTIPAGTRITVNIIGSHRNPTAWDEPDKFKPERFFLDNRNNVENFAFVPFAAGSRNCIGQNFALNEEKTLLSRILQRYDIQIAPDHDPPMRSSQLVLKSENGIWFRVKRRH